MITVNLAICTAEQTETKVLKESDLLKASLCSKCPVELIDLVPSSLLFLFYINRIAVYTYVFLKYSIIYLGQII